MTIKVLRPLSVVAAAFLAVWAWAQDRRGIALESSGPRRHALVIGNRDYTRQPLVNPVNDATDLAAALADLGFDVRLLSNLGHIELNRAVREYADSMRPGDDALFYFSGHGMELAGENYLLPVDFDAPTEEDARDQALHANMVAERLQARRARAVILILDACRNNAYRTFRGQGGGLANMSGKGVYFAFATAPGSVADDNRTQRNGLFTKHLLASIREPGLSIDEVFSRVREEVATETHGNQVPFSNSGLIGRFVFRDVAEERARLEAEIRDLERQAAEAQQRSDNARQTEMERQAVAARERLKLQLAAPPPTRPAAADDLDTLRRRRDAERARLASLAGKITSLPEARLEVASLEKKVESIRAEINQARDAATLKSNVEKGQFETTAQYEVRRRQAEALRARVVAQFEEEFANEAKPYRSRIADLETATYPVPASVRVDWKSYDADRSLLAMNLDGIENQFRVEPKKAEVLYTKRGLLTVETTFAGTPALVDTGTGERFPGMATPQSLWVDSATRLTWTHRDNGKDLDWKQAANYCQTLILEGSRNWRLPTIDELQGIYDPQTEGRVKGSIRLTDTSVWGTSVWSATRATDPHEFRDAYLRGASLGLYRTGDVYYYYYYYTNGKRDAIRSAIRANLRALCVRDPTN